MTRAVCGRRGRPGTAWPRSVSRQKASTTRARLTPNLAPSTRRAHVNGLCADCHVLYVLKQGCFVCGRLESRVRAQVIGSALILAAVWARRCLPYPGTNWLMSPSSARISQRGYRVITRSRSALGVCSRRRRFRWRCKTQRGGSIALCGQSLSWLTWLLSGSEPGMCSRIAGQPHPKDVCRESYLDADLLDVSHWGRFARCQCLAGSSACPMRRGKVWGGSDDA
jgi:hypothetical protein